MLNNIIQNSNSYFANTIEPSLTFDHLKNFKGLPNLQNIPIASLASKSTGSNWSNMLNKGFGNIKGDLIGAAPALVETGLDLIGGDSLRRADIMSGGDQALSTAGNLAWSIGSKLGPIGMIAGGAVKGLSMLNERLGKTSDKHRTDGIVTTGYSTEFNPLADQKYSMFGNRKRKRTNKLTKQQDVMNLQKSVPGYQQQSVDKLLANSLSDQYQKNQQQLWGGLSTRALSAKKGGTISRNQLNPIIRKAKNNIKTMKAGGKLEDPNIIPEGAFHSRKHNLPEEIAKDVTKKGIPVIVKEGGEIKQIAEIERGEIIFNKEISEKIEEYLEEYNEAKTQKEKDKIAIECGKLISNQIINNTIDNVGLLNKD